MKKISPSIITRVVLVSYIMVLLVIFLLSDQIPHYSYFYEYLIFSSICVIIPIILTVKTDENKIINRFILLMLILGGIFLFTSIKTYTTTYMGLVLFVILPVVIFDFFANFLFLKTDNVFSSMRISLAVVSVLNLIFIFTGSGNVLFQLSSIITGFLFCIILYFVNSKNLLKLRKQHTKILLWSICLSIVPFLLILFINISNQPRGQKTSFSAALYFLMILPLGITYVLIKQHKIRIKIGISVVTAHAIAASISSIVLYLVLRCFLKFTKLESVSTVILFLILLVIYHQISNYIINFRIKEMNEKAGNFESYKEEMYQQIKYEDFLSTFTKIVHQLLEDTYAVNNFLIFWKDGNEIITIGDSELLKKSLDKTKLFTKSLQRVQFNETKYLFLPLLKNSDIMGTMVIPDSLQEDEDFDSNKFQGILSIITEALVTRFILENSTKKIVTIPKIKYDAYLSYLIDTHLENINKSYADYLHDELLQTILAFKNFSSLIKGQDEVKNLISKHADELVNSLRKKIFDIYPANITTLSLKENLEILKRSLSQKNENFFIDIKTTDIYVDDKLKIALYRIIKELIINALKHSKGDRCLVTVVQTDFNVQIEVRDNGNGDMSSKKLLELSEHFGLFSIKEKVDLYNGTIRVNSALNEGTTISVTIPLEYM